MRIESGQRVTPGTTRASGRAGSAGAGSFSVDSGASAARSSATAVATPVGSLDALLALQAVEDPLFRKRKLVRRGRSLLDGLEALRRDLLTGQVGEGRLNQLLAIVGQAREEADPELDALIDEIEVRVHVELAKHGRFVSG